MHEGIHLYVQQLHLQLQGVHQENEELRKRIVTLEQQMEKLEARMDSMKSVHIDTVNYKVQELTVRELSGTLTIGMSALTDADTVKKWLETQEGELQMNDLEGSSAERASSERG